jgi:signal transduction histidine kinase
VKEKMGHRYAIVDAESGFERLEGLVWAALGSAFAFCLGLALLLGATTSRRVIRPLVELAEAVEQDRLRSGLAALERPDEVGVLARALVAHDEEAARFLVRERLFTGDVSHELRTPLTVMLGAAEVLASRLGERPDLLAVVERIRRTATETADRVAALLLLSRAPHDLEVRTVSLAPLLEQEMDRCRPLLEGKPVELQLRLEAEPQVPGQPELMAIAVGNLLRNACYFTEAGHVRVTLREHELRIEDTGRGIPAAVQGQVFERFVSGDDRPPGAGLGLAIVQRVCEHLGWTVQLENSDAGGTVFSLAFGSAASSTH